MTIALMVQGTTSDAGKSLLVAALCRILARNNHAVAPFKPQNMALNSAVTSDGGEIGRAQALQAFACGIEPHTDMNPVLLKPSSDTGAQVIIHGKAISAMDAIRYHDYKQTALAAVMESYRRLKAAYEYVIIEGAGSPAEINLRDKDIANMGFAEPANCPVIIIADIDKGGVFAHLVGTLALLSSSEQDRVIGFVINKFRGDIRLLEPGLDWLTARTGKPVFGVIPYIHDLFLDAEDAIDANQYQDSTKFTIVVPILSRTSNHTDFDSLRLNPDIDLRFVPMSIGMPACDLVIIPGSKNVRTDLTLLKQNGWQQHLQRHLRYGGKVIGICGGYQMLGRFISDPEGIEDVAGKVDALDLLPISTTLTESKALENKKGVLHLFPNAQTADITGYEIHCGVTKRPDKAIPAIEYCDGTTDGIISDDNLILGTYLHGLFDSADAATALLAWAGLTHTVAIDMNSHRDKQLNRLADTVESALDMDALISATQPYSS